MVVFRVSVGVGFVGYIMLLLEFTGLGLLFRAVLGQGASLTGEAGRQAELARRALGSCGCVCARSVSRQVRFEAGQATRRCT